jgi:DNA-binding protein HU-beta
VNKGQLVAAVAAQAGSDQAQARRHVEAVFETIMSSVTDGERVVVTGFGTFHRVTRPARTFRNPRTGQPIQVASSLAPRFSVGRTFKEHVSGVPAPAGGAAAPVTAPVEQVPDGKKKKKRKNATAATTVNVGKKGKVAKPAKSSKSSKKAARRSK